MKPRAGQRGFTLIELMVALAISSIMVLMVLGMFSRMSSAYRSQQQITQLQVTLAAAQNLIEQDVKRAGFQVADGFRVASDADLLSPVQITNDANGPDELRVFAADASKQARVEAGGDITQNDRVNVDDSTGFAVGELAVIVYSSTSIISGVLQTSGGTQADTTVPTFVACVVQIARVEATELRFDTNAPWGSSNIFDGHCSNVKAAHNANPSNRTTMIYGLYARAYRIDAARPTLGILQTSASGGLVDDWTDLGLGFTDLQLATRVFEAGDNVTDTADPDTLTQYEWYSGEDMERVTTAPDFNVAANHPRITQLTVSLTARTDRDVDDIYTRVTPGFIDTGRADNNDLGDHDVVDLTVGVPPANLRGNRIYRYSTNRIDLRNTGSGL